MLFPLAFSEYDPYAIVKKMLDHGANPLASAHIHDLVPLAIERGSGVNMECSREKYVIIQQA